MSEAEFLPPAVAAERLRVSPSGLRRLAPIYESVHGELPRTGKGQEDKQARLWPVEAVERLEAARLIVEIDKNTTAKRYGTIHKALEGLRDGLVDVEALEPTGAPQGAVDTATQETLQVLLFEVRALRTEVQELKEQQKALPPTENTVIDDETFYGYRIRDKDRLQESNDGPLVSFARRLERLLRRSKQ